MTSIEPNVDPATRKDQPQDGAPNPGPADSAAWSQAQEQAKTAGIQWERPQGDDRSAQQIIDGTPVLKDLGNQGGVKDQLKQQAGDFTTDADAAYRATQILRHVESFDADGTRIVGTELGNGRIDGFNKRGDAAEGTEAARLIEFGKHGFSSLQGTLRNASSASQDPVSRQQAEQLGFSWERPPSDTRSAQDIVDQSPLLKNLGNQSGVKDLLKEQIGDYDKDPDAAYRATQVLDRVTMVSEDGRVLSGGDVANNRIDGFTKSGEATPGTEASRLQDFGKYGFTALAGLPQVDSVSSYKDFVSKNKDADATSKTFVKYAALIDQNFDAIRSKTGAGDTLSADNLKTYAAQNPQLGQDMKEALNFWSQPAAFEALENSKKALASKPDGKLSRGDVTNWIASEAPKDGPASIAFLSEVANRNVVSGVDTSTLNQNVFDNPAAYTTQEKAAALQELLKAQSLVSKGLANGMWSDDYSKVSISNSARTNPDPKAISKDLGERIEKLESDPEVMKYLSDNSAQHINTLLTSSPGLAKALHETYDSDIASGKALDRSWTANTRDGHTDQQTALAEFVRDARLYQGALKIDPAARETDLSEAVAKSQHAGDFRTYYETELASGKRLNDLLKDHSFADAASAFTSEVALYGSALKPAFTEKFDTSLHNAFTAAASEHFADGASFADLQSTLGVDGSSTLDETKLRGLIDEVAKSNPEFLLNADGTTAQPEQIITSMRGAWDLLRQGTKTLKEVIDLNGTTALAAADKGVFHATSGLLMAGITIAREARGGSNLTERQKVDIAVGSVQTVTLMTEGGAKAFKDAIKDGLDGISDPRVRSAVAKLTNGDVGSWSDNVGKLGNAASGAGALAGIVGGAYALFDGVKSLRAGDKVGAGMNLTSGALGVLAGGATTVESAGALIPNLIRAGALPAISIAAGTLGVLSAGIGVLAVLPSLIMEGAAQKRSDDFGNLLGGYLRKYEIDGIPDGDLNDLPDSAWPQENTVGS